jgi:hypothetical protein
MPLKPCLVCGRPSPGARCAAHPVPRHYGTAHQQARRYLAATLPAPCGYGCGTMLSPGDPWVAAHIIDRDPNAGWIVSCRGCNERAKVRWQGGR